MIYARLKEPPTPPDSASPYTFRFPDNPEIFSDVEAKQLVAEELVEKVVNGKIKLLWDAKKGVMKRWTAWYMRMRHTGYPSSAGN
ncbi:hypothetical protein AP221_26345 [Escherichia coli]|nr:hypothetical protein AP221_26345 [Escherichia coli]